MIKETEQRQIAENTMSPIGANIEKWSGEYGVTPRIFNDLTADEFYVWYYLFYLYDYKSPEVFTLNTVLKDTNITAANWKRVIRGLKKKGYLYISSGNITGRFESLYFVYDDPMLNESYVEELEKQEEKKKF